MRPFKQLISAEEALKRMLDNVGPVSGGETIPITEAGGRVLAGDVVAEMDVPGFRRAAMDGYAVVAEGTYGAGTMEPKTLKPVGKTYAGDEPTGTISKGECWQVATGAPMPDGADAVVMVEDTETAGDMVKVFRTVAPGNHVSKKDADIARGAVVLGKGQVLTPGRLGVLAALGKIEVEVVRKPVVAVAPTGNEVVSPGDELVPGQVYDVNSYTLAGLLSQHGADVRLLPIQADDGDSLRALIDGTECDAMIFSGGSSVGERDILVDVVAELGQVLFHGVAVKPGKPVLCGIVKGKLVVGMPGYPASCLTSAYAFLLPVVRKMAGLPEDVPKVKRGALSRRVVSTIGRLQLLPVKFDGNGVVPVFKESGAITSLGNAEGYVEIPSNVDLVERGTEVEVRLF